MEGRFSKKFIKIFEEMEVVEAAFPIEGVLGTTEIFLIFTAMQRHAERKSGSDSPGLQVQRGAPPVIKYKM